MSDHSILESIKAMEQRLEGDPSALDAGLLEAWNQSFQAEVTTADRGAEWPMIVARAHALSVRIQAVLEGLTLKSEAMKQELATHSLGKLALRAYDPKA